MKWIIEHKTLVLGAVLFIVAFAIGWSTKPVPQTLKLKELTDSLAMLRMNIKTFSSRELENALARQHLEKILRDTLASVARSHKHDSVLIYQYTDLLTRKRTPHEVETEMLALYNRLHPGSH